VVINPGNLMSTSSAVIVGSKGYALSISVSGALQ
jgi:hypothetical protein